MTGIGHREWHFGQVCPTLGPFVPDYGGQWLRAKYRKVGT
jgi:hypothetical protein